MRIPQYVIKSGPVLVHSIHPRDFRNLESLRLEFSPRVNFVSGRNGQGKTNLLESIYWLLTLRGKRGSVQECARKGSSGFRIDSELTFAGLRHRVGLEVEGRAKRLTIDDSPAKRRRDYLENVLAVDFFPEDLLILIMEPALRRRFIDLACVQYFLPHEEILRRFKRLLEQRNSLLRAPGGPNESVLESYDDPLAESSSAVTSARLNLLARLGERTDAIFRDGIGERYEASLYYVPALEGIPEAISPDASLEPSAFKELCLNALRRSRRRDVESGRTTVGPHRDDWGMRLDGKPVRAFASRGEVRSTLFALHLARFHVLTEKRGIEPVVLIDDVMSELDASRRLKVMELLPPGQVFLTSCDPPAELGKIGDGEVAYFVVEGGKASRAE